MRLLYIHPPLINPTNTDEIDKGILKCPDYTAFPPLGIAYLAAVSERMGHECKVYDLNVEEWPGEEAIRAWTPDLILLSSMSPQYRSAKIVMKKLQGIAPIVIGGAHASILGKKLLEDDDFVDIVAVKEGENTIRHLLNNYPDNLDKVPGICYRKDETIRDNGDPEWVVDLDALPFPAWHHFNIESYDNQYRGRHCLTMISSRGCPYDCLYCYKNIFDIKVRMRTPQSIYDEIKYFNDKYNVTAIQFQDDLFTVRKKRVEGFCDLMVENKMDVIWRCLTRADHMSHDFLVGMKKGGCVSIAFGIESGNQEVVNGVGKRLRLKYVEQCIKDCRKVGIETKGYYMIGLPNENEDQVNDTIEFAKKNRTDHMQFTVPVAFPGTKLWEMAKEKNMAVEDHVETFTWDQDKPPLSFSPDLTPEDIQRLVLKARNLDYYSRIWRQIKTAKVTEYPDLGYRAVRKLSRIVTLQKGTVLHSRLQRLRG